jgi:hypothetical protein
MTAPNPLEQMMLMSAACAPVAKAAMAAAAAISLQTLMLSSRIDVYRCLVWVAGLQGQCGHRQ